MTNKPDTLFTKNLLRWFGNGKRDMPWKKTKNPYFIWISEIILQQTQVIQGLPYYLKFIEAFPTIKALAQAKEAEVLSVWKGLGYYSRARNIQFSAKYIMTELKGVFPTNYDDILLLKGVGPYTAAAISSFAFDLPYAVADGNVFRVLSRYYSYKISIDKTKGKKQLAEMAQTLIDKNKAADFNQAIMDLGALICRAKLANCPNCPLKTECEAFNTDKVYTYPLRDPKRKKRKRYFHYLVIRSDAGFFMNRRVNKDIWQGLFDFVLIETTNLDNIDTSTWQVKLRSLGIKNSFSLSKIEHSKQNKQQLTHQTIYGCFYIINVPKTITKLEGLELINTRDIQKTAIPKIVDLFLYQLKSL